MSEAVQTVEQLVAAREVRGLSVADVSQQLKLSPRQVQAIEQADWEALPGPAFTRAVLRGYGRLLGVDVDALVAGVAGATAATELRPTSSLDAPIRARGVLGFGSGGSGSSLAWVGLVVLGLVALALFFGGEGGVSNLRSWIGATGGDATDQASRAGGTGASTATGTETTELALKGAAAPTTARTAQGEPGSAGKPAGGAGEARPAGAGKGGTADAASAPVTAGSPARDPAAQQGAGAQGTAAGTSAAAAPGSTPGTAQPTVAGNAAESTAGTAPAAQGATASSDATQTEASGTGQRTVSLRFARESWIEIRSADGTVLVTGTQQPGTSRSLRFNDRVSLVIGNAEHVKVELDAKPFNIGPSSQAGVARFSLP